MANIRPPKDNAEKTEYIYGFAKGLNVLQDESLIDNSELSLSKNAIIVVDGVRKRSGSARYGSSSGSRVMGGIGYYTSAGNRFIIREGGTSLQYYDGSGVPTNISGATMTTGKRTEFAMARDTLYVENGTDNLVKINVSGGIPVATTFTALSTPTGVAVSPQGTTGSTNYSYRVSAINATGETLASASVTISNGNATLTATNFNRVSWSAVSGATGYNVYGRQTSTYNGIGETLITTVTGVTQYDDNNTETPSTSITVPEGNSTGGQKGSMILYAMGRLWVSGDTSNPSRVYYSGTGTQIEDFSTAYNGGWVDVSKNDGDDVTGLAYFQNVMVIFKHKSIWKLSFTSAGPALELITNELGCESHRTIRIVNNDLWFLAKKDGRAAIYSLGNVANYTSAVLRTTERSLKISAGSLMNSANVGSLSNACAFYFRNLYLICLPHGSSTTNNRWYVWDTRFNAWVGYWDGMSANGMFTFIDSNGNEDLYYCDELSGYVVKMFTGTDDNGTAISWQIQTKNFMQNYFDQYKIYRNPILWFKDVVGAGITGYIITDGLFSSGSFNVTPIVSGIGAGFDRVGVMVVGTSAGTATSSARSDQPMELITTKIARSLKIELDDDNASSDFKFLGFSYKWLLLDGKPLPSTNRIRLT